MYAFLSSKRTIETQEKLLQYVWLVICSYPFFVRNLFKGMVYKYVMSLHNCM